MPDQTLQAAEATYEGNVLRLHQSLPLSDQQRVWVIVMPVPEVTPPGDETPSPDEILKLAAQVYHGLSHEDVAEIERLALDRSHFFTDRDQP